MAPQPDGSHDGPATMLRLRHALCAIIDGILNPLAALARWLVLPLSLLLFLQWPLRDLVQAYSRETNDLAQCLFALYVAVALTYATRSDAHLAAHAISHRFSARTRQRLRRIGALFMLLPWSLYMLYAATPPAWRSLQQLESFPETFNPGYFIIKLAAWLMVLLIALQALADGLRTEG